MTLSRHTFAACLLSCPLAIVGAQRAVATADANVRSGQSTASEVLDHLTGGDTVILVSAHKLHGYFHVQASDGTKGWVYSRLLTVLEGGVAPTPAGVPNPTPSSGAGKPATAIDPAWAKPTPTTTAFHRNGFPDCGPAGEGGDAPTNLRKNRTDEPTTYHAVSFATMVALPYPKNHKTQRATWPKSDLDVIAPMEGVAVSVTGFIAKQRGIIVEDLQNSPKGESTNCHATDDPGVDWHMTIVGGVDDPKSAGIVVETTPRVRANGHPWTAAMLAQAIADRDSVRISGWLMYDPEHFAQTTNYDPAQPSNGATVRATLWEVHPITRIEVFDKSTKQWHQVP